LRRSISIIIPAYNEESRLPATLERVCRYLCRTSWEFAEVIVVDDGSRDATGKVAEDAGARVLSHPGNRGKGYSVRQGMLAAQGDWALLSDADLSTPMEELEKLWSAVEQQGVPIAIGSRALNRSLIGVRQPLLRDGAGRLFNQVMRRTTGLPFRDTQCGFKLFASTAAHEIFSRQLLDGFGFDVEVLYIARSLGFACVEIPVKWNDAAGSKVSLGRGFDAFVDLLRVRWNAANGKYQ